MKKITLIGPESTGKTTLARQLATHFDTVVVEEYGRIYCEKFGNDCDALDLCHIAAGQLYFEDEAAKQARHNLLICDTDVIVTQTYAELYLGSCPDMIVQLARSRQYELYLLLDTDVPYVNDGTRLFADRRQEHFNRLKEILESQNRPYAIISATFEERFARAVVAINEVL
ncbi:MAG: AAA family ATPase [Cytophagaceae bacterium]|nr:AAA family ATPase [Cytophagaceae bacterium]